MPNRRSILIVDDEPQNLAVLRQILNPYYRLYFGRDGVETLDMARKYRPDLILLDVQMPDMDGYAVCRLLRADVPTRDIPVIFVTGLNEVGHEEQGFASGAVDYIVKPVSAAVVLARVNTHLSLVRVGKLERSYRDSIAMLAEAGHYNDEDTGSHIWRMASYARLLAEAGGWDAAQCDLLEQAAPMHDTGKIGIPSHILRKPGKLDEQEWLTMKTHPQIGYDILSKSEAPIFELAAKISLYHHERWDGTGYPKGLVGEEIPEAVRIVSIADVFDALTTVRPYKRAWSVEDAVTLIRQSAGRHFDPVLTGRFLALLPEVLRIRDMWAVRDNEKKQK